MYLIAFKSTICSFVQICIEIFIQYVEFSAKSNTRFQYKLIKKGGRASEFENAIEWLCLSGIVSQVHKVEQIKKPLENYRDIDAFKIYVSEKLIPIEVKSADNTRAKSLKIYMDTYHPEYAIKLSAKNFGFEGKKKIVPLYAAFCI